MTYLLQKPPNNFEDLVVEHFDNGGRVILTACKAYSNGFVKSWALSTCWGVFGESIERFFEVLYPVLVEVFGKNDSSSLNEEFLVQLSEMVDKLLPSKLRLRKGKKQQQLMSKLVLRVLKKFLGQGKIHWKLQVEWRKTREGYEMKYHNLLLCN